MRGNIIKKREISFAFEKNPRVSLSCMLVPAQAAQAHNVRSYI